MSTIVYQNHHHHYYHHSSSFFDSQTFTETTLKLKLAAPPSPPSSTFRDSVFLQSESSIEKKDTTFYTQNPNLIQNSSSFTKLSAKSLELCTESLCSETGCDSIFPSTTSFDSFSNSPQLDFEFDKSKKSTESSNAPLQLETNSRRKVNNFPPPLTTISGGSSSLQVRRRRENGRLIIEAIEAPIQNSCFQAERIDGRLRLCINPTAEIEEEEEKDEIESEGEMNGVEMELIEKFGSFSTRCNNGNYQGLSRDWKPAFNWVATS